MLAEPKLKLFRQLVADATAEELIWISGYISALVHNGSSQTDVLPAANAVQHSVLSGCTVVYGTGKRQLEKGSNGVVVENKKSRGCR